MRGRLAMSALLAVLVATTICSSVRADVLPSPQSLLLELKEAVLEADDWIFRGVAVTNTRERKNALTQKIDATIGLYDITERMEAADKLVDDLRPKLTDPWDWHVDGTRKRARSWLELYPEDSVEWGAVSAFAARCQGIIETILDLYADPGQAFVDIEPHEVHPNQPAALRLRFKSYRPYTIFVFSIEYEVYVWLEGDVVESGVLDPSDTPFWETGVVPLFQEVLIYGSAVSSAEYGSWVYSAVFHTSAGDFTASHVWHVTPW